RSPPPTGRRRDGGWCWSRHCPHRGAVAAAKAHAASTAVEVSGALFEVSGTRSALNSLNLHRHWRDARTHTLHDPARWKIQHIGRYVLNGTLPPRHGLL
ncbi:acyl-CoA dehydrogenase family protein, partial [Streptomyces phaeochromogenes]|uniref:acyl-CoA dehydrogenase family protein n=1 Tax=Streptomyces phaeochromogenes TaxID=1923 RepID=UPI003F4D1447